MYVCYNCFNEKAGDNSPCIHCGYSPETDRSKYPMALPHGTILAGRYITGRVLSQGSFGITYAALDRSTGQRVAIKEYFPDRIADRSAVTLNVTACNGDCRRDYEQGLEGFIKEAGSLAALKNIPKIEDIYTCFKENGTAYFVMEYVDTPITDNSASNKPEPAAGSVQPAKGLISRFKALPKMLRIGIYIAIPVLVLSLIILAIPEADHDIDPVGYDAVQDGETESGKAPDDAAPADLTNEADQSKVDPQPEYEPEVETDIEADQEAEGIMGVEWSDDYSEKSEYDGSYGILRTTSYYSGGSVKSVTRFDMYGEHDWDRKVWIYTIDGMLGAVTEYNMNGTRTRVTYKNPYGNGRYVEELNPDGSLKDDPLTARAEWDDYTDMKFKKEYDGAGKLVREVDYYSELTTVKDYNKDGSYVMVWYYHVTGSKDIDYYDPSEKKTNSVSYYIDGKLKSVASYDSVGNRILYKSYGDDGSKLS